MNIVRRVAFKKASFFIYVQTSLNNRSCPAMNATMNLGLLGYVSFISFYLRHEIPSHLCFHRVVVVIVLLYQGSQVEGSKINV